MTLRTSYCRRTISYMTPSRSAVVKDYIRFALIALIIVVPIRWFVAQPFFVRGESMVPTFHNNEYLIVDQLTYRFEEPKRGDVIIMRYPKDESTFFIKRIIGLPNETIELQGLHVIVRQTGKESITLDEPYIETERTRNEFKSYTLGPDEYFVMGDNRYASSDSRSWGNLPRKDIVGRALFRMFPPKMFGVFPGAAELPQ